MKIIFYFTKNLFFKNKSFFMSQNWPFSFTLLKKNNFEFSQKLNKNLKDLN